jgi:hypothetical protein
MLRFCLIGTVLITLLTLSYCETQMRKIFIKIKNLRQGAGRKKGQI